MTAALEATAEVVRAGAAAEMAAEVKAAAASMAKAKAL